MGKQATSSALALEEHRTVFLPGLGYLESPTTGLQGGETGLGARAS